MHAQKKSPYLTVYIFAFILFVIFTCYIIYITYLTRSNINNNYILENDSSVTIYAEKTSTTLLEIATYSTRIYDKDENRIHNITLACEKLNGHIVKSGYEFSFNTTLGKMDKQDGFKKAISFDGNGNLIKSYGGGVCQLSSTLYNSALIAKLEITERHAHSRRVSYVPKNKDATIYYGGPDFKFINNTPNDIIIFSETDGNIVTVTLKSKINK